MVRPFNFGDVTLDVSAGREISRAVPASDDPFRIVLLGDFSGRSRASGQTATGFANRRPVPVDRDNFDEVFTKIGAEIRLPLDNLSEPLHLQFTRLDDFHPDRIFQDAGMFRRLRELRARLQDPATFPAAAQELGLIAESHAPSAPSAAKTTAVAPSVSRLASGSLLDEMIEQSEVRAPEARPSRAPDEVREFARRVAEPLSVAAPDPRQAQIIATIDRAIGAQMRALLHTPDFQALEAAWRAVFLLVRRIETNSQLKLYLVDVSKEELFADLSSSTDLRSTNIYRLLVEGTVGTPGAEPWAVIAGNYTFGPGRGDAEVLGRIAKIARAAGAPFIAAASPRLLGCGSFASTPQPREWKLPQNAEDAAVWTALRRLPEASAIGLALPRFLLRLPYGRKTAPVESFDFEEMPDSPPHEDYLWGNPAFACVLLLAQSFSEDEWEMRPGSISEIDGLPLHVYEQGGESELKPCAEALMTENAANRMLENGLMPLASLKGRDAVRLARFQSIAEPLRGLAGPWSR